MIDLTQEQKQRAQFLSDAIAGLVRDFTVETGITVIGQIEPVKVGETTSRVQYSYQVGLNFFGNEAVKI